MAAHKLDVRLEQIASPVGSLESDDGGSINFSYREEYLASPDRLPLSLSLPLRGEAFADVTSRAFFQNLLPENDQLDQVIEREGLAKSDVVGLLFHLGADLSGAVSCVPEGSPPVKVPGDLQEDYLPLSQEQLEEIVTRLGKNRPLPDEVRDPSPVAGYQRKVALSQIESGFAVPRIGSGAPTTHILKVPDTALPREAYYEHRCAELAQAVGLDVAESRSAWIAGFEVLIATRFDRAVVDNRVYRLHQEDFAQALGLPPRLKYEREGKEGRIFNAASVAQLLQATAVPATSVSAFLTATFFNLAIGNTDNHAKNHALLYAGGSAPRVAPLYDLVPIRLSDRHHHRFSFKIGKAEHIEELCEDDVRAFLATFGLEGARAARFIRGEILPIISFLSSFPETKDQWARRMDRLVSGSARLLLKILEPMTRTGSSGASAQVRAA